MPFGRGCIVVTVVLSLVALRAAAQPVLLDQNFTPPSWNVNYNIAEGAAYIGQTMTAGIAGRLVSADLYCYRFGDGGARPWIFTVRPLVGDVPGSAIASTATFDASQIPTLAQTPLVVNFPNPAFFNAGDRFAIVVQLAGTSGVPALSAGGWAGTETVQYPRGDVVASLDGTTFLFDPNVDLLFRTRVQLPEPGPAASGFLVALFLLRRLHTVHPHSCTGAAHPASSS
jgi:hypothetical protein